MQGFLLGLQSERRTEDTAELTRDLKSDLLRKSELEVRDVAKPAKSGERTSDISLFGQLAVTFLTSGAAVALVSCLKAYIERDQTLRFKLTRSDGSFLELEGKQLEDNHLDESLRLLEGFARGKHR